MTEQARIFISHSAADRREGDAVNVRAHDVRTAIRKKVENDPRFRVLIDEIQLKAGDSWRARINLWLGLCDAAVLVLSPAALKSHYVAFEANILGYRWALDHSFRIIPVLVGMTMDEIKNSPLNPAQVSEWQSETTSGTPDEVADKVLQALAGVVVSKSRPIDRLATVLKSYLPSSEFYLDDAAQALAVDEIPWSIDEKTFRLALRMLGSGMADDCARAIRILTDAPEFKKDVSLDRIKELITSAWVDMKADEIPPNARTVAPRPMLLNATSRTIAETYMIAARYRKESLRYKLVEAAVIIDEQVDQQGHEQLVIAKVRTELETALRRTGDQLATALAGYHSQKEAVVVVLHEHSLTPTLLPKLRDEFKHVTFFVLGGPTAGSIVNQNGDMFVVIPPLDIDEEQVFLEQRDSFCGLIDLA
jgi:hypothetical protein